MNRLIAFVLILGLMAPACATAQRPRFQEQPRTQQSDSTGSARERELLAELARQLPAGARVRASDSNRKVIRGTLIKATDTGVVIQPRGRVPEPIVEIPFASLATLEQEQPSNGANVGKAVAIGAGAGAAAALGVILILIAALGD
jgi:hypothetical protein